jgi:D-alanyl-D-alanine carboxypeptidase (penicillin-binding protein 5/6)
MSIKSRFLSILFIGVFCLVNTNSWAAEAITNPAVAAQNQNVNPWGKYMVPAQPDLDAKAYVLMDAKSGAIAAAKNADAKLPPASLTKLMTLYLVFSELASGHIHLTDQVLISKKAWQTGGSRMFVQVGTHVTLQDLIMGVTVQSGNDATMALAEYLGGTDTAFVQMMDDEAKKLGMNNSHFSDPTGLPAPDHLTTATDLAILARALITQFPQYYHFFGEKWFTWNGIRQPNRNRLLWRNFNVDGLKTGHTDEAGFCLISSSQQDNTRLIAVVLGAPSDTARADDSQALLNYGFRFFQTVKVYNASDMISEQRVWKGASKYVSISVPQDFYITIPRTAYSALKVSVTIQNDVVAPVVAGEALGTVNVYLKDQLIAQQNLVAMQADPAGGWWTRFTDAVARFFHNMFHKTTDTERMISGGK